MTNGAEDINSFVFKATIYYYYYSGRWSLQAHVSFIAAVTEKPINTHKSLFIINGYWLMQT